jgi:hypothetical protein
MLDQSSNPTAERYVLRHYTIPLSECTVGEYEDEKLIELVDLGYNKSLMPGRYWVQRAEIQGTLEYDEDIDRSHPVYVWGVTGEHYGWTKAEANTQEPWSEVLTGQGGNAAREGILHTHQRAVTARSYIYSIYDERLRPEGLFPDEDKQGVSFSVFAKLLPASGVARAASLSATLAIWPSIADESVTISLKKEKAGSVRIVNQLCQVMAEVDIEANGVPARVDTRTFPSGTYLCIINSDDTQTSAKFTVLR